MSEFWTMMRGIVPGLPAEVTAWWAEHLEDGSQHVLLNEIRVLAEQPEPGTEPSHTTLTRVARIAWRANSGEIMHLWVAPVLRRQGVATRLYATAQEWDPQVRHSAWRTRDGDAWARSVAAAQGETLPPLKLA